MSGCEGEGVRIVAVVGLCGSGKTVVSDYVASKGYHKVHFGALTLKTLKERGLPPTEATERPVSEELRERFGMAVYAERALPEIEQALSEGKKVLIDGLYSFAEYKVLKKKFGKGLVLLAVYASPEIRHERLRERLIRPLNAEEAVRRDLAEIEKLDKGGPIAIADATVLNESTLEELYSQVDRALERCGCADA